MAGALIASLILAILVALLVTRVGRRRGPGPGAGLLFFFLIVFLFVWAGGIWITPFGPMLWGLPYTPFLTFSIILLFIILALTPAAPPQTDATPPEEAEAEAAVGLTFGCFFWILLFALLVSIVTRYAYMPPA